MVTKTGNWVKKENDRGVADLLEEYPGVQKIWEFV